MIFGDDAALLEWEIPLEAPCRPTKVHRLMIEGFELSNAIEWAHWNEDLAWLSACELCGQPECSGRGLARFRRLEDQLIWMRNDREGYISIGTQGVLAREIWDRIRRTISTLPKLDSFQPLRRADLARLWLAEMPERIRAGDFNFTVLESLLRGELAAGCPLEGGAANARVRELIAWFEAAPDDPVAGRILRVDPPEGLHTFIFDRPTYPDWAAFAASERWTLAFEGGFLYEFPTPPRQ